MPPLCPLNLRGTDKILILEEMNNRFPENAPGGFYTTGTRNMNGGWFGGCLDCGLPEAMAPELMTYCEDNQDDSYFIKQPTTPIEIGQAITATEVYCIEAVRYGRRDKKILCRIDPSVAGYKTSKTGNIIPSKNKWWQL